LPMGSSEFQIVRQSAKDTECPFFGYVWFYLFKRDHCFILLQQWIGAVRVISDLLVDLVLLRDMESHMEVLLLADLIQVLHHLEDMGVLEEIIRVHPLVLDIHPQEGADIRPEGTTTMTLFHLCPMLNLHMTPNNSLLSSLSWLQTEL
jgi:hypothetical protein